MNTCIQFREYKPFLIYLFCISSLLFFGLIYNKNSLEQTVLTPVITGTQQLFGSLPLPYEQEAAIRAIIKEMGIDRTIIIRKMNQHALGLFGYHNAIAYNPVIFGFIPFSSVSFLFISEGFFEDLTPAEQKFLIGHEAAHIKHEHLQYLPITLFLLFIFLCIIEVLMIKRLYPIIGCRTNNTAVHFYLKALITALLLLSNALICMGITRAYRRYIEKQADITSLQLLGSHDGLTQLIDRWQKEYKLAEHNPYFGLIADHPSCAERKAYCCELQNKQNRKDLV